MTKTTVLNAAAKLVIVSAIIVGAISIGAMVEHLIRIEYMWPKVMG